MTLSIKITTSGSALTGQAPAIIQQNLDRFVAQATHFLAAEVRKRTPQGVYGAQGGLLASIQAEVGGKGTPQVKGIVASAHKYAEVVEKGRTAGKGMPPKGTLLRWLEVKLGLSAKEAQRIEFVVRRKIGLKGTKGAFMFEKSVTENNRQLETMAAACGLSITMELNG